MWGAARELVLGFDAIPLGRSVKFTEDLLCAKHQATGWRDTGRSGIMPIDHCPRRKQTSAC